MGNGRLGLKTGDFLSKSEDFVSQRENWVNKTRDFVNKNADWVNGMGKLVGGNGDLAIGNGNFDSQIAGFVNQKPGRRHGFHGFARIGPRGEFVMISGIRVSVLRVVARAGDREFPFLRGVCRYLLASRI